MAEIAPLTPEQKKLAEDNIRIAYWLSHKYLPPYGMDRDDWESECMACLVKACRWYDPAKGALGTLLDRLVYLRRSNLNSRGRVKRRGSPAISLDAERGTENAALQEFLAAPPDDNERQVELRDLADRVLQSMEPRAREILLAFGEGMTHQEVADLLQVSRQRVTQIVQQARYRAARLFPAELVFNASCLICGEPVANFYSGNLTRFCRDCMENRCQDKKRGWYDRNRVQQNRKRRVNP